MADSDIQVTALTALQAGPGAINVVPVTSGGSCLPYLALAAVEIWGATTNNRANATNLGDTIAGFLHSNLTANATRYYWARARDASGNYGDWYPSSTTAGRSATTSTVAPGPNSVGTDELKDDAVTGSKVKDGAVTQTKIANAAIVNAHLGSAIIARANIQNAAIGSLQVEYSSITNAHVQSLSADKLTAGTLISTISYTGTLVAAQVTSGIFTGLTFQTSASGTRCVISAAANQFSAFNGSSFVNVGGAGSMMLNLWAASGFGAVIRGNVTTAETPLLAVSCAGDGGLGAVIGARGTGASHGARVIGKDWYSSSTGQAASDAPGGSVVLGVASGGGGWAAFSEKGGFGPFTGGHDAFVAKNEPTEIGDIVCDLKVIARNGVDDTVTEVYVAEDEADPAAVGVISRRMEFDPTGLLGALPQKEGSTTLREILAEKYDRLAINSLGEGQVNVCGRGGDITAGDLIMTSTLRGKGQRQPDGIVRAYTVAKARESVTFSGADDWKRVSCIYLCG